MEVGKDNEMSTRPAEWDLHYLNQQFSAMRWLAKQGLTPEEIRTFKWGSVDESSKMISVTSMIYHLRYDKETGTISRIEEEREIQIPIEGSGNEWFFLKSKYTCPWMFTAIPPKTWRREGSKESLFPLEAVETVCKNLAVTGNTSILTFLKKFSKIEVSKLNITKMETEELIEEAEVV